MLSLTGNRNFYIIREDIETFRLYRVEFGDGQEKPYWRPFSALAMSAGLDDKTLDSADRRFFLAALALSSGEAHQRRGIARITARGTRNILLRPRTVADYIEETKDPKDARAKREKRRYDPGHVNMDHLRITQLIKELLPPLKKELRLPEENPAESTYTITERVIDAAVSDECKGYLREIKVGRLLTQHMYDKLKQRLQEKFPADLADVVAAIDKTASRDHLSAVSLTSVGAQLMVGIVNIRGDMVTMEDWKFLQLIEGHGEFLSLGTLDARGGWLPEPLLKFNANKIGEVVAIYTAKDSTLHVVCKREVATTQGKTRKETPDRSEFVIDQDYLTCLYITILQLREEKKRFQELRERAEAKTSMTIDEIFDRQFFYED